MEIVQGTEYTIIRMPENLSANAVDAVMEDFSATVRSQKGHSDFLLDMGKIQQLHRAGLVFIQKLEEILSNRGGTLSIAGLSDPVENALRFQHVDEKIPLYKTIIDYERQRELDFLSITPSENEAPEAPHPSRSSVKSNVMIIDPSIAARNNQKAVLTRIRVDNIIETKDPPEALKRLRAIPFEVDILFADFNAVKPITEEFVRRIRALPSCKKAKIILTAANDVSAFSLQEALAAGIDGTINKNFGIDEVRKVLE